MILDVLEVGKESLSSKLDIAKFLVLVSYAVRFATVKIYVNLDEVCRFSNNFANSIFIVYVL